MRGELVIITALQHEENTMTVTLGFDVYGTLIDTHGVITRLETMIGEKAAAFSTHLA